MPVYFLTYATTKFEAEKSDIGWKLVRKGVVKPHATEPIQYMKLIETLNLSFVWYG